MLVLSNDRRSRRQGGQNMGGSSAIAATPARVNWVDDRCAAGAGNVERSKIAGWITSCSTAERPFLLCAMVLIAATFSLRMQRRGGATLMIMGGVATAFALFFLSDIVFALGLSATIPVVLAAWTPAGVSMLMGAAMLLHLEDG
jgi:hypothetical protein